MAFQHVLYTQDIHLSQFYTSPLNLNPATTSFFAGTHRFCLNYKNQWSSITIPYRTMTASIELNILKRKFHRDILGGGLQINRDKAGDSEFGIFQSLFSLSYIKLINSQNNHFISIGIQTGPSQKTINYNALMFDNQFDGDKYNPNLSHEEQFNKKELWYLDFSSGLYWFLQLNKQQKYEVGIALFHINTPNQSFLGKKDIYLDKKFVFYSNNTLELWDKTALLPSVLYMRQGKYQELTFGARLSFIKERRPLDYKATNIGFLVRHKDAIIPIFGIDYKSYNFGISYDINISKLRNASESRGGLELSFNYRINKSNKLIPREIPCPIF